MALVDIFPYSNTGAKQASSQLVTTFKPIDAKEVATAWDEDARRQVDIDLVYEGMKVYSRADKTIYYCIEYNEDGDTAADCTWTPITEDAEWTELN